MKTKATILAAILFCAAAAHSQTTLTVSANTSYSALAASTTTSLAADAVNLSATLTLDSSASAFALGNVAVSGTGVIARSSTAAGFSMTFGTLSGTAAAMTYGGTGAANVSTGVLILGAASNWSTANGGLAAPNATTAISLNGNTLSLDGTNNAYSCLSISDSLAGYCTITNTASGTITVTAGTLSAGTLNGFLLTTSTSCAAMTVNVGTLIAGAGNASGNTGSVLSLGGTGVYTVNLSGLALSGTGASAEAIQANHANENLTVNGGTLQSGGNSLAVYSQNSGTLNLNGCTVVSSSSSPAVSAGTGVTIATSTNLVSGGYPAWGGRLKIGKLNANNYSQFLTATGTINQPAAAQIVGPWKITNTATGSINSIGPYPVGMDNNGNSVLIGVGTIR